MMILPFLFPLSTVEDIPAFGALVGIFFDITKVFLMATSGLSTSILPQLIGLIPLPLMGAVGTAIGWFISLGFLMAYAAISFSRKEFSDTMRGVLTMAPVVGALLGNTFESVIVRTGTKFANRYDLLKFQLETLWNTARKAAELAHEQTIGSVQKTIAGQQIARALNTAAGVARAMPGQFALQKNPLSSQPPTMKQFARAENSMSRKTPISSMPVADEPPQILPSPNFTPAFQEAMPPPSAPPEDLPTPATTPTRPTQLVARTTPAPADTNGFISNPARPTGLAPRNYRAQNQFAQYKAPGIGPTRRKVGGKRFTRRQSKMSKWRKTRHRRKSKRL